MRITNFLIAILTLSILILTGCGSGGNNTSGTLTLAVSKSGNQVIATVKFTALGGQDPVNTDVTISSTPNVFSTQTVYVDRTGTGVAILNPTTNTLPASVTITARTGDVVAPPQTVTFETTGDTVVAGRGVALAFDKTTVNNVVPVVVTAQYTDAAAATLEGITVNITTDHPELFDPQSRATDSAGQALFTLPPKALPDTLTYVIVTATANSTTKSYLLTVNKRQAQTLSLAVNKTTVSIGTPLTATATFIDPNGGSVAGKTITFSSDAASLFDSVTATTNQAGVATAYLIPKNGATAPSSVDIRAAVDDLIDVEAITVQPETLTISPPADASKEIEDAVGGIVTFVPSGVENFTVYETGSSTPLANTDVTLSVQTVLNSTDNVVTFWQNYPAVPAPLGTSITVRTDSAGKFPIQATVDVTVGGAAPGETTNAIITVIWKVTYTSLSGPVFGYASTMYEVTNTVPE